MLVEVENMISIFLYPNRNVKLSGRGRAPEPLAHNMDAYGGKRNVYERLDRMFVRADVRLFNIDRNVRELYRKSGNLIVYIEYKSTNLNNYKTDQKLFCFVI